MPCSKTANTKNLHSLNLSGNQVSDQERIRKLLPWFKVEF